MEFVVNVEDYRHSCSLWKRFAEYNRSGIQLSRDYRLLSSMRGMDCRGDRRGDPRIGPKETLLMKRYIDRKGLTWRWFHSELHSMFSFHQFYSKFSKWTELLVNNVPLMWYVSHSHGMALKGIDTTWWQEIGKVASIKTHWGPTISLLLIQFSSTRRFR